ncbi:AAA family ATPase [Hymenobacter terrenus]|uniref:AAA family ATPase n=1 Tax=Hymenobacter terrenus TaxID=1629124 RepID=UPI0006193CF9|nr:AAA family ATPase [Hymenobacter terrenus]
MYIKEISISGVGAISNLHIKFDKKMNLICGPNGIGKTTILESIAHLFLHGDSHVLKRSALSSTGLIKGVLDSDGEAVAEELKFNVFSPIKEFQFFSKFGKFSDKVIVLKTSRAFNYAELDSISRDVEKNIYRTSNDIKNGININEVKNWFVNRYLYSGQEKSLNEVQLRNIAFAKKCFELISEDVAFERVDASTNDIMVMTPSGEVFYEYLSSGFKSILAIILGIIKEVEYRFTSPKLAAPDFNGIIIIDELELHLHPEWQEKVAVILSSAFPKAQFICTTHSPHIIQFAEPNQIIALQFSDGAVKTKEMPNTKFGFKGWTIEEILTDVMGMEDTRTTLFTNYMNSFNERIDEEDYDSALRIFNEITSMLHPRSELRKVLQFQLSAIKVEDNDKIV